MDVEVCIPDIGIDRVEVIEIFVQEGEMIKKEDSLISVEGHKSVLEIPSPTSGKIKKVCIKVGDIVHVNKLIALIDQSNQSDCIIKERKSDNLGSCSLDISDQSESNEICRVNRGFTTKKPIHAAPNIRRMARMLNIDLSQIEGSGNRGRITREDLKKYSKMNSNTNFQKKTMNLFQKNHLKDISKQTKYKSLSTIQQVSGNNLLNNWKNIPHVTQFDDADITNLEKFRKSYNLAKSKDKKYQMVSLLAFIVKAVMCALIEYPRFNSMLDVSKKRIVLNQDINIGIAVDTEKGLLVPVLKDLRYKNVRQISKDIANMALKAKNNQLSVSEMTGGSFTISSLGGIGGTGFTPIINAPEACILGISKASIKPVWSTKEFLPRLILPFSLSYDHRIIDGADGVRFTTLLSQLLSDIRVLLV
ncbi:2-oxo acid dehydrogenase subunit E2 [Buchnera aphidicola]|uniref:2-oxo acid dehydrogenase subunit E2 n=1 Tax=Buchnera aphidicola TaxID=9 RepID=UPI00094D3D3F|nr:2-oxo acid dehydrogenase subunit E2 [Buchnera aphidicola]